MMSNYGGFSLDIKDFKEYYNQVGQAYLLFEEFLRHFIIKVADWMKENVEIEILNGKEYASFVEYGHRGKYVPALGVTLFTDKYVTVGRFMMRISMEIIRKYIPRAYSLEFKKYLKSKGIE